MIDELGLSMELWLNLRNRVIWIGVHNSVVVIGINHDASLGQNTVLTLGTTGLNVPHELFFITLCYKIR